VISFDTNILFPALEPSHVNHAQARDFLESIEGKPTAVCELVLMEIYVLVRNPVLCNRTLNGLSAVKLIQTLRTNPGWRLFDYPGGLMAQVWQASGAAGFARRRVFDARLAVTLRHYGVTHFATANTKDFASFGFTQVWNPLIPRK
jgi:uncharacterized protein